MRRKNPSTYFIIFALILAVISLPILTSEKLKGVIVSLLAPLWNITGGNNASHSLLDSNLDPLELENQFLRQEIVHLKEILQHEIFLIKKINEDSSNFAPKTVNPLIKNRLRHIKKLFNLQLEAVPAKIIFRSVSSWNSSLWLNVGNSTNTSLGRQIIQKNSPVVIGTALVGVIDFVGNNQCRVRLITDSKLSPAVRAVRNAEDIEKSLNLAKGEIRGSSNPLWRSGGNLLKGFGFNYDFADEEGSARPLIPGNSIFDSVPIIKIDDILITSGMDGVFPIGLNVAKVTKVHPLKEGDYTYEIEAEPIAGNLNNLSMLYILPAVGYDPTEKPPIIGG